MHSLLYRFRATKCKDLRDRVYGLLGLIPASEREQVVVDYDGSVLKICLNNTGLLNDPGNVAWGISIFWTVETVYGNAKECLSELQGMAQSKALRAELPARLVLERVATVHQCDCYTFAMRRPSSAFVPFTTINEIDDICVYMSLVTESNESLGEKCLLYSTCPFQEGDFLLRLQGFVYLSYSPSH